MKKTLHKLFIIFLISNLFFLSCSKENKVEIEERYKLNLTMEEKIAEYECFWDFIYNGFPMIEVLERRGVDLEQIKKEWYKKLSELESKYDYLYFYAGLCSSIKAGKDLGHLGVISYNLFDLCYRNYFCYDLYPDKNKTDLRSMIDDFYVDDGIDYSLFRDKKGFFRTLISKSRGLRKYLFADTKILENDKIAYLRVDTFINQRPEEKTNYYKALDKFFSETKNYKHLIIDVSHNSGGFTEFWEYIVAVHLRRPGILHKTYGLYSENKYTKPYLRRFFKTLEVDSIDIDSVPNVKNANTKLHKKAYRVTHRIASKYEMVDKPREDRKIWVLIGEASCSASDRFANFCKQTAWATLVGENTSGLGSGILAPQEMPLPNSGLLIRWDLGYGLNPDGTCNDEFGIAPDIYTEKGKTALETCLDAIEEYDGNNEE